MIHNAIETGKYLFKDTVPVEITSRAEPIIHVRFPTLQAGFYTNDPWRCKKCYAYSDPVPITKPEELELFRLFFDSFSLLKTHTRTDISIYSYEYIYLKKQIKNLIETGFIKPVL